MDRLKQRIKKDKQVKSTPKEKYVFITDVKSIKENLKIKEILRTVKMNSSMRLKGPPGSKIMSNKDFNDDDCPEEFQTNHSNEPLSACNPDVVVSELEKNKEYEDSEDCLIKNSEPDTEVVDLEKENEEVTLVQDSNGDKQDLISKEDKQDDVDVNNENSNIVVNDVYTKPKIRPEKLLDRKLSLDQSILSRRQGFSQSELDLHSLGKSPLERKVSFFRKKMDSFVRNTTEMFKRQNDSLQRRGSMSMSLQSLNEKSHVPSINSEECEPKIDQDALSASMSLHTVSSMGRSNSSLSMRQSVQSCDTSEHSFAGSQPALHALSNSTLEDLHSNSVHSLNEAYLKEAMLNSRAISMSSGLDLPLGRSRTKASRSNRVTWVASEGLTNYFRRLIQDEKSKELQSCHSYQDFSSIPENELYNRQDIRNRKLSYQRAVSGDDHELMRYHDSSYRRRNQFQENEGLLASNCSVAAKQSTSPPASTKGVGDDADDGDAVADTDAKVQTENENEAHTETQTGGGEGDLHYTGDFAATCIGAGAVCNAGAAADLADGAAAGISTSSRTSADNSARDCPSSCTFAVAENLHTNH
ncbi:unnamed protein product [Danaus chrysippus]|uniref:(African queen) hypothetical protein n=1 Tax=Danaus chrysippus TaxID=151541 RepID=A0A8J2M9G2_9NEOP|nr:unnamed protein product [Danaus chrysippus]